MTFPSNPCYLPLFEPSPRGMLERYTSVWINFVHNSGGTAKAYDRLEEYNGKIINDAVIFDTEQDKMWFILKWS